MYEAEKKQEVDISIHSLRMEGDECSPLTRLTMIYFNPLPPHGGRRITTICRIRQLVFQSTPSAWRETTHSR